MKNFSSNNSVFIFFIVLILLLYSAVSAQTRLRVVVIDKSTKEEMPFTPVDLCNEKDTVSSTTDFNGIAQFKDISPGKYSIKSSCIGYQDLRIINVIVAANKENEIKVYMSPSSVSLDEVMCIEYKVPIIDACAITGNTVTREDFSMMATKNVLSIAATTAGVYQADEGEVVYKRESPRSSRSSDEIYVDGVKVRGGRSSWASYCREDPGRETIKALKHEPRRSLTAAEVNDFSKWSLWKDLSAEEFKRWKEHWEISPEKRFTIQLMNHARYPLVDAAVTLFNENDKLLWSAKTDNTGKAELWGSFDEKEASLKNVRIAVSYKGKVYSKEEHVLFDKGINRLFIDVECEPLKTADIAFVVDATGSMGDEIGYLQSELKEILSNVGASNPGIELNLGSVFYRDHGDEYVTRTSMLDPDHSKTISFIGKQEAAGGGDGPEAVEEALEEAVENLNWSDDAVSRMIFFILDASPHRTAANISKLQKQIKRAAERGIRIIPVMASGGTKDTEFLMGSMAIATNGTYIAITDHSGIGNPHMKPSTDKIDVVLLKDLIASVIQRNIRSLACTDEHQALAADTVEITVPVLVTEVINAAQSQRQPEASIDTIHSFLSDPVVPEIKAEIKTKIRYYPNPAVDIVNIEAEDIETMEIFVTDEAGKIISRHEYRDTMQLDLSGYAKGIYHLLFYVNGKKVSGKLVKL